MRSRRTNAARGLRRFFAPTILSVLLHASFLTQGFPLFAPVIAEQPPLDVILVPPPNASGWSGEQPVEPEPIAEPTMPPDPPCETRAARRPRRASDEAETTTTSAPIPSPGRAVEQCDQPPRPLTGPAALHASTVRHRQTNDRVSPPLVEPGTGPQPIPPAGSEAASVGGSAAGAGAGFTFDFWSPPVFEREMARATEKIGRAEAAFQREKTTDLGHGVICNETGHWFVCEHDDIARCNEQHDGKCRYAKPKEEYELSRDQFF
jgi:hypothetical protein